MSNCGRGLTIVGTVAKFHELYNDVDGQINSNKNVIRISKQALSVLDPDKVSVDNIWKHMLYLSAYTPCRLNKMYVYKDEVLALKPPTPYSGEEVIDAVIKLFRDNPRTGECYSSRQDTPFPICEGRQEEVCTTCNWLIGGPNTVDCFIPEKDNPYPLCVGRGFDVCNTCCRWADLPSPN